MVHALSWFLMVLLLGCTSAKPMGAAEALHVAERELGNDIDSYPNQTGKYTLYVQRSQPTAPNANLRFLVIEIATARIAERQSFMPGYVKWVGDDSLEALSVPGIVREGEDMSKYKRVIRIQPLN